MSDEEVNPKAYPLADTYLTNRILNLVQNTAASGLLRKGVKEVTKAVNRGVAEFVVMASDADPMEILLHLPLLCKDKNVPYVFVKSKISLGSVCGINRPVIACCVIKGQNSSITSQVQAVWTDIERLLL
ncbi:hypothetical protein Trydic_g12050 [Trypoxylus dichotomus]